jgi:hypothetical protein
MAKDKVKKKDFYRLLGELYYSSKYTNTEKYGITLSEPEASFLREVGQDNIQAGIRRCIYISIMVNRLDPDDIDRAIRVLSRFIMEIDSDIVDGEELARTRFSKELDLLDRLTDSIELGDGEEKF